MKKDNRAVKIGDGNRCTKCKEIMERRKHPISPVKKTKTRKHYFSEWDWCEKCKHLQHYEQFKVHFT